jgi:hypothetical protein
LKQLWFGHLKASINVVIFETPSSTGLVPNPEQHLQGDTVAHEQPAGMQLTACLTSHVSARTELGSRSLLGFRQTQVCHYPFSPGDLCLQPGMSLFFSFSGHGSQKQDYSGDEDDGMDETILPTDYQ